MPSWSYFFDPYPASLIASSVVIARAVIGGCAVMSILLVALARRARHDPPRKRFIKGLMHWWVSATIVGCVLYFFRQQRIYLISTPLVAVAAGAGLVAWSAFLLRRGLTRMREGEAARRERAMREKYMPRHS